MNYTIAMWCSPYSQGAEYVVEMSDDVAKAVCYEATLNPGDNLLLAAVLAKMVKLGLSWVYAAAAQRNNEGTPTWYYQVDIGHYAQRCMHGCSAGHPVCAFGRRLYERGQCLFSVLPAIWPDVPSDDDQRNMQAFHQVGDVYLRHIGQAAGNR